jgi:uncharacterized protein
MDVYKRRHWRAKHLSWHLPGVLVVLILTIVTIFLPLAHAGTLLDDLIRRAKSGDAEAEVELGNMYRYGVVALSDGSRVEKNIEQSLLWLRKAGDKDYAPAEYELGEILYKQDTIDFDEEGNVIKIPDADIESLKWLRRFLEHKDIDKGIDPTLFAAAEFMIGMEFYQTCADYPDYISFGSCRPSQRHLVQDYKQAQEHLRAAAEAGHPEAEYRLGTMYETGRSIPQDYAEAAKWYRLATESGLDGARGALRQIYMKMGDNVSAYMWANLAAIDNNESAVEQRDQLAKQMSPADIIKAQRLAREWDEAHKNK